MTDLIRFVTLILSNIYTILIVKYNFTLLKVVTMTRGCIVTWGKMLPYHFLIIALFFYLTLIILLGIALVYTQLT